VAFVLAGAAVCFAAAVLIFGWLFDVELLRRLPGLPGMSITAAAGLLGIGLILLRRTAPRRARGWGYRPLAPALLLAVALLDILLLAIDPARGLDHILFSFSDARDEIYRSPATATCLALAALGLLLPLRRRRLFGVDFFGMVAASGLAITVFTLTGYVFDSAALREIFVFAGISPHSAIGYFLAYLALAASQPEHGWMRAVLGPGPGSAALRRMLPFVVLGPFLFCWLALVAVDSGVFNANFRLSVLAIAGAGGLTVLLFWGAQRQNTDARDLVKSNAKLRRALAERDVLLREVYHRVKNNLQFIDAMLALEANDTEGSAADAKLRLREIRRRLHALGLVHQQLMGAQDLATMSLANFLRELCANMAWGAGLDEMQIDLELDIADLDVDLDRAIPIGLVMTELLSNAAKHAFPAGRRGVITIEALQESSGCLVLHVSDNGVGENGIGRESAVQGEGRVGSMILDSLVEQLNAEMLVEDNEGYHVTIRIPF
jgi:two-component sensor histidine kinase